MIELDRDELVFRFPEVHPDAALRIDFQRTLRIPDDESDYPLPPGLGRFPLRHVDDFGERVPAPWNRHGGVLLPMYQSEAMWLNFTSDSINRHGVPYPFAIKVAAGKIDTVSGERWCNELHKKPQNYVVAPDQPWLDGFCVEKGLIRQFVAMPLGSGYSAEEQITGKAEHGGLQIMAVPMKWSAFEKHFPKDDFDWPGCLNIPRSTRLMCDAVAPDMGLTPGGRMRQEIAADPFDFEDWDFTHSSRCFVHIANSLVWRAITGGEPPLPAPTAKEYADAGLPWFEHYSDAGAIDGAEQLARLKSVMEMGREKGEVVLPENESVEVERVVPIRTRAGKAVREGEI